MVFAETLIGKLLVKTGIKPLTDGIVSIVKEVNDPNGKISSRRGSAVALIATAITMATTIDYSNKGQVITMLVFAVLGTVLLAVTSFNANK